MFDFSKINSVKSSSSRRSHNTLLRSGSRFFGMAMFGLMFLSSCSDKPVQSKCTVEVYSPVKEFSIVDLLDCHGHVIDTTLSIRNDSIIFTRTDSLNMPYIVNIRLRNPEDPMLQVFMPIVIEGGVVNLDLTETKIDLRGTKDNKKLFKSYKAIQKFQNNYDKNENPEHDLDKLKKDYSAFYSTQILENKGTVVGDYLYDTYNRFLTRDDRDRVNESMKENL